MNFVKEHSNILNSNSFECEFHINSFRLSKIHSSFLKFYLNKKAVLVFIKHGCSAVLIATAMAVKIIYLYQSVLSKVALTAYGVNHKRGRGCCIDQR